jgi:glycosyltransferase involved in cell wall biosynthesis
MTDMKIVQALGSSGRGGSERFFIRLANALHARGISQTVLTRREAWATSELRKSGVEVRPAWFAGKLDVLTRMKYRQTLMALPADIAVGWKPNAVAACPAGPWVRVGRLGRCDKLDRFASCDHLLANSPRIVAHIKAQGWPSNRISYIPNFVPEVHTAPARRAAFNTPEDAPLILWLGRMDYSKGPDLMVKALAETPDAYLWMAGAGAYEEAVKKLSAGLGVSRRIRFLGWRDDIHALLRAADIFVRSSRGEGLGNVLEAWANGLPVISVRSEDASRLIADGQSGLLAAKDDSAALAMALKSLMSNRGLARRLGEAGKLQFQAAFSEEPVVAMYLDLFRRLQENYAWRTKPLPRASGVSARPTFAG